MFQPKLALKAEGSSVLTNERPRNPDLTFLIHFTSLYQLTIYNENDRNKIKTVKLVLCIVPTILIPRFKLCNVLIPTNYIIIYDSMCELTVLYLQIKI